MATLSAQVRSSERVSLRRRNKLRMRSRASWNSLSSLACSGQQIAWVEEGHIKHLLKTSREKVTGRRTKGKYYFRLLFGFGMAEGAEQSNLGFGGLRTCRVR
jgi:hypothetical protein